MLFICVWFVTAFLLQWKSWIILVLIIKSQKVYVVSYLALQEENLTLEEYIVFCLFLLHEMEKYLNYFWCFLHLLTKRDMFVGLTYIF